MSGQFDSHIGEVYLKRIEGRLTPHILNVALAAVGKREGDLREAKDALVREVARIAWDACSPGFKK
jgi:hypothetical protein